MNKGWIIAGIVGAVALYFLSLSFSGGSFTEFKPVNTASLVLMLCWFAFIATGVLGSQGSFKQGVQNIVLWVGIILVLMAGYTYRYELQDVASTMTAGIVPPSPISKKSLDGRNTTTLIRAENGHYEAVGEIAGKRLRFLVDTGASAVVLNYRDAEKVGFDVSTLQFTTPVTTANGVTTAARIRIDSLSINGIEKRGVRAMVTQPGALEGNLLGMSYIDKLWGFEIRGDRMIFTD